MVAPSPDPALQGHPRLGVIVPALNEAGSIVALLDRLQPLRLAGHEVIVVDGGSTDGTAGLARPLADRVLVGPRGRAVQMNAGAASAASPVLWFLHADSTIDTASAAALLRQLRGGARWGRFDVRLSGNDVRLRVVERMMNWRSCITGIATGDQGIFVERALFDAAGGYPAIALMEDIALSKALRRLARPQCIRSPRLVTSSRRWESRGVLRTVALMWWLRLAFALGVSPDRLARWYR